MDLQTSALLYILLLLDLTDRSMNQYGLPSPCFEMTQKAIVCQTTCLLDVYFFVDLVLLNRMGIKHSGIQLEKWCYLNSLKTKYYDATK